MTTWVVERFQVIGVEYSLHIGLDGVTGTFHRLGHKHEIQEARDLFRDVILCAKFELNDGLVRGGIDPHQAAIHPRSYIEAVRTYIHQVGWCKTVKGLGTTGQTVWQRLRHWKPDDARFQTWFGVAWNQLTQDDRDWFRNTVLATLLGLLADERQQFDLKTGATGTLGSSIPYFGNRVRFDMLLVQPLLVNWQANRTKDDGLGSAYLFDRINYTGVVYHPCAFQELSLAAATDMHQIMPKRIQLKRPSKLATGAPDWRRLWRQTVIHEASHAYANTDDYYYYTKTPTNGFSWFRDAACFNNVQTVCPGEPWIGTANGQLNHVWPPGVDYRLPLANADTVAAYLCGWNAIADYPLD